MATQITTALLIALRSEINAALKSVADKHGISLSAGSVSYTATNATFKLMVNTVGATGEVITKEASDLKRHMQILGLTEAHLTQTFPLDGGNFVLTGYRTKASAKPFLMKRVSDGKTFIASEATIRRALGLPVSRY